MRNGAVIAASCIALALGACSGAGSPPSADPGDGPATGEPTGGGTQDALESARAAVAAVSAEIEAIEGLPLARTDAEIAARNARVAAAREQYDSAIALVRRAVEAAEEGSAAHSDAAALLRGFTSARAGYFARLDAALTGWASVLGPQLSDAVPVGTAVFKRFPRGEADGSAIPESDRLSIRTDAVVHSVGKTVISRSGGGLVEELPVRSLTLRTAGAAGTRGQWVLQGRDGTPDTLGNTDGVLNYSAEFTADGLVWKIGGNAIYYDFQRRFDMGEDINDWFGRGPDGERGTADDGPGSGKWDGCWPNMPGATADCTNWIHDDIMLTFGRPSQAPNGVNAFYWSTRIPFPEGVAPTDQNLKAAILPNDSYPDDNDLGIYELWMSNYAGVDRVLEYTDGRPYPDDDSGPRYLDYAAYGLFTYTDLLVSSQGPGRMQAFHFGYDAFADEDDLRTTDIAEGSAVSAAFTGETIAYMYQYTNSNTPVRVDMRGDITLNARIGAGANTIYGEITRLQKRSGNAWEAFPQVLKPVFNPEADAIGDRLVLAGKDYAHDGSGVYPARYSAHPATINADGSYEGGVFLQYYNNDNGWMEKSWDFNSYEGGVDGDSNPYNDSIFGGAFYGPRDGDLSDIETAGYWYLAPDHRPTRWGGIVGSFGAERAHQAN